MRNYRKINSGNQNLFHFALTVGKGMCIRSHTFLDGYEKIGQRSMVIKFEILSVLITQVLSPRKNEWIVAVVMGFTVTASIKDATVVEDAAVSFLHFA